MPCLLKECNCLNNNVDVPTMTRCGNYYAKMAQKKRMTIKVSRKPTEEEIRQQEEEKRKGR